MEKKLTAQGPKGRKSYTVTLPIEWVKQQGLDRNRLVHLDIVGNKAIISPEKQQESRAAINADEYSLAMVKVVQGIYRAGVDEVKISFSDSSMLGQILDIIEKQLIGYEIVEQKRGFIVVKDITRESEEDFRIIFRRIFLLLLELSESDSMAQAEALNRNIKKLVNYCQRILMKKGHADFAKVPLYYLTLDRMEKLTDEFRWLLKATAGKKKQKGIIDINSCLKEAYSLFYTFDPRQYNIFVDRTFQLKQEFRFGAKADVTAIHLHNLARLLNSFYGDIFALKFNE